MSPVLSVHNSLIGAMPDFGAVSAAVVCAEPWADARRSSSPRQGELSIAIVDDRPLISECFSRSLRAIDPSLSICHFRSIAEYESESRDPQSSVAVVMICATWSQDTRDKVFAAIEGMKSGAPDIDVVLLSDISDSSELLHAVELGVRGYIPTSVRLEVAVQAIHLVAAGGVYIPASALFSLDRQRKQAQPTEAQEPGNMFTSRQLSVIEALRCGKANKIIAYDLNMCESTVKVHVRNIMKRLKARNRTEVAYILNNMDKEGKGFKRLPS